MFFEGKLGAFAKLHGIRVHQGQAPSGFNWDPIVDTIRDEQIKDASGL
jgi:hypothetical protein